MWYNTKMNKEIERKFLISVETFKELAKKNPPMMLDQGYYVLKKGFHTRVRIVNNKEASITTKTGSGMVRTEYEQSLDLDHAQIIFSECQKVLRKQRIKFEYHGKTWDIDFFIDHNIAVAEVELTSEDEHFAIPSWVIKEVTGDKKYSNIALSKSVKGKLLKKVVARKRATPKKK